MVDKLKEDEYQCAICKGIFKRGWSKEEAQEEYKTNFPDFQHDQDPIEVCDDCYKEHIPEVRRRQFNGRQN